MSQIVQFILVSIFLIVAAMIYRIGKAQGESNVQRRAQDRLDNARREQDRAYGDLVRIPDGLRKDDGFRRD